METHYKMKDTRKRTVAKTITFRALATITTMLIVYLLTGHLALSLGVGALETVSKLFLYYGHERAWERIRWGKW